MEPTADRTIRIDLARQRLELCDAETILQSYPVSTARNGPGEEHGSECTPRGAHAIEQKIGDGAPPGSVFVAREPTGEICDPALFEANPARDWILTRILWLGGLEAGRNLGANVDTRSRHIYIHGCPETVGVGSPSSHGCIRMRNADVIDLFEQVDVGTRVEIEE